MNHFHTKVFRLVRESVEMKDLKAGDYFLMEYDNGEAVAYLAGADGFLRKDVGSLPCCQEVWGWQLHKEKTEVKNEH